MEIIAGKSFAERSRDNSLRHTPIFPERGIIYDRNGAMLAWNNPLRTYAQIPGLAHVVGYIGLPNEKELKTGKLDTKELIGKDGVEQSLNSILSGEKGLKIEEVDVKGNIKSDHLLEPPKAGKPVYLSIDSRIQKKFFETMRNVINERDFSGGAGLIMDVRSGEIISLVSYPEYDPNVLINRKDSDLINSYFQNSKQPFLNRAISGLYTPGSVVKPIMALAALNENLIDPEKKILSKGQIEIPNPYDPTKKTVFKDWKAHGWVNMKEAIGVSSDVYFYAVGGGFADQKGLGIARIEKYMKMFGLSVPTGVNLNGESEGTIPNPKWKEEQFPDDPTWRIGNTYHTAIGQYGVLITPIQMIRAIGAVANGGKLMRPTILKINKPEEVSYTSVSIPNNYYNIIHDGMRLSATIGTAKGLNVPYIKIAAKTGTAELGVSKARVNSWLEGFFPYDEPKYAFVLVLERGHRENLIGGVYVMRQVFDWMAQNTPEYFK